MAIKKLVNPGLISLMVMKVIGTHNIKLMASTTPNKAQWLLHGKS